MALCQCGCGQDAGLYKDTSKGTIKGQPKKFLSKLHQGRLWSMRAKQKTHCSFGHAFAEVGRNKHGGCKKCAYERERVWTVAHPGETRRYKITSKFGITIEQKREISVKQGGKCAICKRSFGEGLRPSIDHDHACCAGVTSCGKCVRGLLCNPCNSALGLLRDNIVTLQNAIHYLRNAKETQCQTQQIPSTSSELKAPLAASASAK